MYQLKKRLFRLRSYRRKGFGVHSPYAFSLITTVIAVKTKYPVFKELKEQQKQLWELLEEKKEQLKIYKKTLKSQTGQIQKIKSSRFVCRLVFRLQNYFQAKNPLYLSNSLYFPIVYMANVNKEVIQHVVVENNKYNEWLVNYYRTVCNIQNINIKKTVSAYKKPHDFIMIDGVVNEDLLIDFQQNYKNYVTEECMIIIGNIYKNSYHRKLWQQLKTDDFFTVRIDYFPTGILIARKGMQVQEYKL